MDNASTLPFVIASIKSEGLPIPPLAITGTLAISVTDRINSIS